MVHTGAQAWRNGFSVNAADVLQIFRWSNGLTDETFARLLLVFADRSRGERVSVRRVERVLQAFQSVRQAMEKLG